MENTSIKGALVEGAITLSILVGAFAYVVDGLNASASLCQSQAPRVTASTDTNIFNRCTRNLPDGTVLTWNKNAQHQKDLASGVALKLE